MPKRSKREPDSSSSSEEEGEIHSEDDDDDDIWLEDSPQISYREEERANKRKSEPMDDDAEDSKRRKRDSEDHSSDDDYVPPLSISQQLESQIARRRSERTALAASIRAIAACAKKAEAQIPPEIRTVKKPRKVILPPPFKVDTWDDLVKLAKLTKELPEHTMYRDCQRLPQLLEALLDIDNLVGLKDIKQALADHVIFHTQVGGIIKKPKMCHIFIAGNSGCGKTTLARYMAKLFNRLGLLKTDNVVTGTRATMIAGFLGQTAPKTQAVINRALGGVLLLDESYALGTGAGDGDSFSQECIDTLNQNLTEKGEQFVCILVGYKKAVEEKIFAHNEGFARRFQWRFELPEADGEQLSAIFHKMLKDEGLTADANVGTIPWFKERLDKFPQCGGSLENFISKIKVAHCKRVFGDNMAQRGIITVEDLQVAYRSYEKFEVSQKSESDNRHRFTMYL